MSDPTEEDILNALGYGNPENASFSHISDSQDVSHSPDHDIRVPILDVEAILDPVLRSRSGPSGASTDINRYGDSDSEDQPDLPSSNTRVRPRSDSWGDDEEHRYIKNQARLLNLTPAQVAVASEWPKVIPHGSLRI